MIAFQPLPDAMSYMRRMMPHCAPCRDVFRLFTPCRQRVYAPAARCCPRSRLMPYAMLFLPCFLLTPRSPPKRECAHEPQRAVTVPARSSAPVRRAASARHAPRRDAAIADCRGECATRTTLLSAFAAAVPDAKRKRDVKRPGPLRAMMRCAMRHDAPIFAIYFHAALLPARRYIAIACHAARQRRAHANMPCRSIFVCCPPIFAADVRYFAAMDIPFFAQRQRLRRPIAAEPDAALPLIAASLSARDAFFIFAAIFAATLQPPVIFEDSAANDEASRSSELPPFQLAASSHFAAISSRFFARHAAFEPPAIDSFDRLLLPFFDELETPPPLFATEARHHNAAARLSRHCCR